ncbi:MAG: 6-pyruvoyl tetrahydropterin synthase family protein [Thermoplasmata archaeon]|nr:6-pyruvoyl tetrahydropterin synthase family protein [Thermoplasmata archaeon]
MKLKLNGWDLNMVFSSCHFLAEHDKCSRLHGHNYGVHLTVKGDTGPDGIIMDFVILKKAVKAVIEDLDHRVLLPGNSKVTRVVVDGDQVTADSGNKHYSFPLEDVVILDLDAVSAEMLAHFILQRLLNSLELPPNVQAIGVGVDEGKGQGAWIWQKL